MRIVCGICLNKDVLQGAKVSTRLCHLSSFTIQMDQLGPYLNTDSNVVGWGSLDSKLLVSVILLIYDSSQKWFNLS